jgi:hypothetical protein
MKILARIVTIVLPLVGCTPGQEISAPEDIPPVALFEVGLTGLPPIEVAHGHYQLWASLYTFPKRAAGQAPLHEDGYISLGEFLVDSTGRLTALSGEPVQFVLPSGSSAQLLDDMIVTIQPAASAPDTGQEEPGPVVLGGKVVGDERTGRADLGLDYTDAFETDFSNIVGSCTILAPTSVPSDSNAGIWFVEHPEAPVAGLAQLPRLPGGWVYEGWVVRRDSAAGGAYFSTGKFTRPDSADQDGAGPGSGQGPGLNFPGQDFITGVLPAPDLSGGAFSFQVTLEPVPDTWPTPFGLRLLSSEFTAPGGTAGRTRRLENVMTGHLPGGRVIIHR